jgi:Transposase DDE domain
VPRTVALFPAEHPLQAEEENIVRIKLSAMALRRPRQWGACWLFCQIYAELGLDQFWKERLPASRKGTRWDLVFQTLCAYRLIDPGSEWRLHRQWFEQSAMGDVLAEDFSLAALHKLYECHDFLLEHKAALFDHLTQRWKDLFNAKFEVLLYDLTSTYFESDPPFPEKDKRQFGYSRDKRPDCVQVVIALIVTPEGFPLAYEVMHGNTSDRTTLKGFLEKIEKQYGKAQRIWVMDRGIPTEETLAEMRASDPPVLYLVGTPKGRLTKLQKKLVELPWEQAREGVEVKLLDQSGELYVLARSVERVHKERSMRRRQLKGLWKRLKEIAALQIDRDALLLKLGGARQEFPSAWRLAQIQLPSVDLPFTFKLNLKKLRQVWRREGRYLLRTNMPKEAPAKLWEYYLQLVQIEAVFKQLKGDLAIRPIFHQKGDRVEAHIFVSFLAYCVQATLSRRLKDLAPGLTARAVLEKMAALQMIDVHLPTTDGRTVVLTRYTQPEVDQKLLLEKLKLTLPDQPPPKITAAQIPKAEGAVVKT